MRIRGVIFRTKIEMKGYNKMCSALRDPRPETRLTVYRPSYIIPVRDESRQTRLAHFRILGHVFLELNVEI